MCSLEESRRHERRKSKRTVGKYDAQRAVEEDSMAAEAVAVDRRRIGRMSGKTQETQELIEWGRDTHKHRKCHRSCVCHSPTDAVAAGGMDVRTRLQVGDWTQCGENPPHGGVCDSLVLVAEAGGGLAHHSQDQGMDLRDNPEADVSSSDLDLDEGSAQEVGHVRCISRAVVRLANRSVFRQLAYAPYF